MKGQHIMPKQVATRRDLETALIEKCWKDPEFRQKVVSDPKGMLEQHIGQKLSPQLKIFIHEEDANTLHFSIPPAPANLAELDDEQLDKVAGGTGTINDPFSLHNSYIPATIAPITAIVGGDGLL
jgi:hypothetical protein